MELGSAAKRGAGKALKPGIEEELYRFERFQLANGYGRISRATTTVFQRAQV